MKPSVRLALIAAVGLYFALPAWAACGAPFLITSIDPNDGGNYSYVITPGVTQESGLYGSSITENMDGFFWAVGHGDVAPGVGADNGTFGAQNWFYLYPNYPATLLTTWAASTEIDTCIDVMGPLGERCMAMVLTDLNPETNQAAFAVLSAPDHPASGDFSFVQVANIPIQLVPMAQTRVLSTSRNENNEVEIVFGGPGEEALLPAAYVNDAPACQVGLAKSTDPFNGLIVGYRMHRLTQPRGSGPPSDFRREAWEDLGLPPTPLDAPVIVVTNCSGLDLDEYFAYSLVFDGGFELPYVSRSSSRIECGPNYVDPEAGSRTRKPSRQRPTSRQR